MRIINTFSGQVVNMNAFLKFPLLPRLRRSDSLELTFNDFVLRVVGAGKKLAISLLLVLGAGNSIVLGTPGSFNDEFISTMGTALFTSSPLFAPEWTSDFSSGLSAHRDYKILIQTRDDAAAFVASEGAHRGAFLEAAIVMLNIRGSEQGDLELATWILSHSLSIK